MAEEKQVGKTSTLILFFSATLFVFSGNINLGYGSGNNQIVSKSAVFNPNTNCTHPNGTIMADGEHSSSGPGACDAYVCHIKPSGNYYVYLNCPSLNHNPDPDNCKEVSNSSESFPKCCPELQCGTGSLPATASPTACYDLSTDYACSVWSNLTNGCTDYSEYRIQNFTTVFCEKTCGICTPSG